MGFEILQPVHPANNIISAHLQEALIVAQPEDPIKHLCESINEEVERRTAPPGQGGSFANEETAMIRGSLAICGRDGRRHRVRIERHANKDMTTGARVSRVRIAYCKHTGWAHKRS
jgi:hypothetical protein